MPAVLRFCPDCQVFLLDEEGACPSCGQSFDPGSLPEPTRYDLRRSLLRLERLRFVTDESGGKPSRLRALGMRISGSVLGLVSLTFFVWWLVLDHSAQLVLFSAVGLLSLVLGYIATAILERAAQLREAGRVTVQPGIDLARDIERLNDAMNR